MMWLTHSTKFAPGRRRATRTMVGALAVMALVGGATVCARRPAVAPAPGGPGGDASGDLAAAGAVSDMTTHAGGEAHALHTRLTPVRPATASDSARARALLATARRALAKYRDAAAAEGDGYRPFLPHVKGQQVLHYTNYRHGFLEAFRFDPARPTSLLYRPHPDGRRELVGAMYTAPKGWDAGRLDARVPLGIARWHRHVNWCLPREGEAGRWGEMRDGRPLFGPESMVATRAACDAVGGEFREHLFGWMVHVNAFAGDDLAAAFGDAGAGGGAHHGH